MGDTMTNRERIENERQRLRDEMERLRKEREDINAGFELTVFAFMVCLALTPALGLLFMKLGW